MAVSTDGGFVVVNGSGFIGGSMVLVGGTPASSTVALSYTQLGAQVPAKAAGTYSVTVVRPDSVSVNVPLGVTYSASPAWSTASDLGNVFWNVSYTKTLAASSDSNVIYSNSSVLPASSTFASNGTLTGTGAATNTLFTFSIQATDSELQDTVRTFSLNNVNPFVPADAIYSLRKVNPSYTGNCIQVRRSSDNAVANVGFTANVLDESTLLTFVGSSNDGFVTTWYDQSGAARNVSQATAANQPGIVGNGSVVREGTSPALWFSGLSYLDGGDILDFGANSLSTCTFARTRNAQNQAFWNKSYAAAAAGRSFLIYENSVISAILDFSATGQPAVSISHNPSESPSVYFYRYTRGSGLGVKINGGTESFTANTSTGTGDISRPFRLGAYTQDDSPTNTPYYFMYGTISEHVHYLSAINDIFRIAMENNVINTYKPTPVLSQLATGGTVSNVNGYTIHAFTSSGNFITPAVSGQLEYLVVAGGGGGGGGTGGGGGGGGVIQGIANVAASTTYTVTIGGGGSGGVYVDPTYSYGTKGTNSVFGTFVAFGGGGGGTNAGGYQYGQRGGSGGGSTNTGVGGAGIMGQGFGGGYASGWSTYYGCGGGGGAGGPGVNGTSSGGGNGGPGMLSTISGLTAYYGGGGGGGSYSNGPVGSGGLGGGGAGGAVNGTANTGGGGGGQINNNGTAANAGGSGIVYLRYMLTLSVSPLVATGGTVTTSGAYTIHTFTTSGSFVVTSNPSNKTVEILLIAGGGGGGGGHAGGGGGGGGFLTSAAYASSGTYTITVGGGGAGGSGPPLAGSNSSAFTLTAIGGGLGGQESYNPGGNGGSGGGGSGDANTARNVAGSGTAGQGYAGGTGNNTIAGGYGVGGGGGGAGQVGANATGSSGGNGGNGLRSSITGSSVYYAGGGGGGGWIGYVYGGIGGLGGGGYAVSGSVGNPGLANTGGGGAGGDVGASPRGGGAGGSGIIIIKYLT